MSYNFKIEVERETDGRWIAEIPALPGVMVYGKTRAEAVRSVYALALRVLADRIERTKRAPAREFDVSFARSR
jgi:predicted RNase H-like HicB family nuclease